MRLAQQRENRHSKAADRARSYRLNRELIDAAASGEVADVRKLISRGANVNFRNKDGETPLSFAAAWGQLEVLRILLESGSDPNQPDRNGGTPLMLAAQHGSLEIVSVLLRYGADPRRADLAGHSALDHTQWRERKDAKAQEIRRLLEKSVRLRKNDGVKS